MTPFCLVCLAYRKSKILLTQEPGKVTILFWTVDMFTLIYFSMKYIMSFPTINIMTWTNSNYHVIFSMFDFAFNIALTIFGRYLWQVDWSMSSAPRATGHVSCHHASPSPLSLLSVSVVVGNIC